MPEPAAAPMLSVVIPAFNNGAALAVTLASLARQTMPADGFEVAPVVDRFAERLRIRCVRNATDRGRAANRNLAAAQARAAVLVFLDADTPVHPTLLDRHRRFHAARAPDAGVLIARRFEIDWSGADALCRGATPPSGSIGEYRGDLRDVELAAPHHRRDLVRAPWMYAFTHNVSVDRASFEGVGGFDEAMVGWGGEDAELFYRIFLHNGRRRDVFCYDDEAVSYHLPHFRPWVDLFADLSENVEYFFRKHPRYDVECFILPGFWGRNVARIGWFTDALAISRRHGLGSVDRLPAPVLAGLEGRRALVIGHGAASLPLGAGSHTFDHDAAESETNWHLIGFRMPSGAGTYDVLVHVDLWRFLLPDDLSSLVSTSLASADEVRLVATGAGPDPTSVLPVPFAADVEYLVGMLSRALSLRVDRYGEVTVLSLTRSR
jgi:glycosyltransferase involved in cell wall biosynthesis